MVPVKYIFTARGRLNVKRYMKCLVSIVPAIWQILNTGVCFRCGRGGSQKKTAPPRKSEPRATRCAKQETYSPSLPLHSGPAGSDNCYNQMTENYLYSLLFQIGVFATVIMLLLLVRWDQKSMDLKKPYSDLVEGIKHHPEFLNLEPYCNNWVGFLNWIPWERRWVSSACEKEIHIAF